MKIWGSVWLSLLLMQSAVAKAAPQAVVASVQPAAVVLGSLDQHGYDSPASALQRLESATDASNPGAPLELRRRYQTAVAFMAIESGNMERANQALDRLAAMARSEGCGPCETARLIGLVQQALEKRDRRSAETRLALVNAASEQAAPPDLKLAMAIVRERVHNILGQYDQGIATGVEALRLADSLDRPIDRLRIIIPMIGMNADLGDLQRAAGLARDAAEQARLAGSRYHLGMVRLQQGYVHALAGEDESQLAALEDALRILTKDPGNSRHVAITLSNISDYYLQHGDADKAMSYARRAEALARATGDTNARSVALANQGLAAALQGDLGAARSLLQQGILLAEKIGSYPYVLAMTEEMVKIEERAGQTGAALEAMRKVVQINREMSRVERERAVLELQEKYAADRRQREIEKLQAADRLRESERRAKVLEQRLWTIAAIALGLLVLLLGILIRRIRRHARRLALENTELAVQSAHDPLTGAFNRRHAEAMLAHLEAGGSPVGLMLLDLDFFKRVNDTHGHAAGDAVLVEVSRRLRELVRANDAVVRWGGEEFLLVLPGACADGVLKLARRVMATICETPVEHEGIRIAVTVSIGCVESPLRAGASWVQAIHVADLALYRSKSNGRNRATLAHQVAPEADIPRLLRDLECAREAGDVVLDVVEGPPDCGV